MRPFALFMSSLLCLMITACSSQEEPEPTYNWYVAISIDLYKYTTNSNELHWVKRIRKDERYELNKTESYIKEQKAKYDKMRVPEGNTVTKWSYTYKKVDYIPINKTA